jgi:phage terminase small subunit
MTEVHNVLFTPRHPQGFPTDPKSASSIIELIPDDAKLSPRMKALSPRARAFVLAMIELGGANNTRAAAMAGFTGNTNTLAVTASRLAADPRVQEALMEEARGLMQSSSLLAVATVVQLLKNENVKAGFRLQAAKLVLDYAGMQPTQKIEVTHEIGLNKQQQIQEVINMSKRLGLDPQKLLGAAGVTVDAEFEVVGDTTGIEDLLK